MRHLFCPDCGYFLAFSAAGGRLYNVVGATLGPGRARSGRSKSGDLASNHGIAFRPASAWQDYEKKTYFSFFAPPSHTRTLASACSLIYSHGQCVSVCGPLLCGCGHCVAYVSLPGVRMCAVCTSCAGGRVCASVCWNPAFQLLGGGVALLAAAARVMYISHRPSSSQTLYFVAATVQQQSRIIILFPS